MQGIYKITNKINNHCYVGSSKNIQKRWREHGAKSVRKHNDNKYVYNNHLSCALRKYGRENFKYEILEIVEDENKLLEREKNWYFKLNPEYNNMIPDRVGICCGKSHSQKTKEKISKNNCRYWKDKKLPKQMINNIIIGNKNKRKQIIMLNKDTNNVIMEFDGICNALRYLNKNPNNTQTISDCCKGKLKTAYGYKWKYK